MKMTLTPRFLCALRELPVIEPRAESARYWLRLLGPLVMAKSVVDQPQRLRQHPALAVILAEERRDAGFAVAAAGLDLHLEVVEGDEREHRVAQLGILGLVNAPEALGRSGDTTNG